MFLEHRFGFRFETDSWLFMSLLVMAIGSCKAWTGFDRLRGFMKLCFRLQAYAGFWASAGFNRVV